MQQQKQYKREWDECAVLKQLILRNQQIVTSMSTTIKNPKDYIDKGSKM